MTRGEPAKGSSRDGGGEGAPPPQTSTKKLASDTILNLLGQILPLCAAILLVPGLVRALGLSRFGILSLAWMLIGYFGLFDLGLGRALTQAVSARLGRGENGQVPEVVGTSMAMMLVLGILGAAVLHDHGVKAVCLALFPLVALLVAFAPEGLTLWLGVDFAANASLPLRILAAGVFVNSLAHVPFALVQGAGRADLVAKLHLAELIPYLLAVVLLIRGWGIEGAALAWTARVWLDGVLMFWLSRRLLPAIRMVPSRYALLTGVSVAGFLLVAVPTSMPVKITLLAVIVLLYYLLAWVALLTPEERGAVRDRLRPSTAP